MFYTFVLEPVEEFGRHEFAPTVRAETSELFSGESFHPFDIPLEVEADLVFLF